MNPACVQSTQMVTVGCLEMPVRCIAAGLPGIQGGQCDGGDCGSRRRGDRSSQREWRHAGERKPRQPSKRERGQH
jgi:hypothetical protein